ncbi:MAG: 2OG-Fe(II) oxygenase [Myxococcota bacterium]
MQPIYAPGVLSPAECQGWIARLSAAGMQDPSPAYPPSYRNNDRRVIDDLAAGQALFERVRSLAPPTWVDAEGTTWTLESLNPRLRACRYRPGQRFTRHRDGPFFPGGGRRSMLSLVMYLDQGFEGGHTRFFASQTSPEVTWDLVPSVGAAAIFPHDLWHEGQEVHSGLKHVLRSDLVYRPLTPPPRETGHQGYVWCVLPLADGTILSGGRDGQILSWVEGRAVSSAAAAPGSVLGLVERDDGIIASTTRAGVLSLWRRNGPVLQRIFQGPIDDGALLCAAALPGGRLVIGTTRGELLSIDGSGQVTARKRAHRGWVWGLAAASSGALASVGEDGGLCIHGADGSVACAQAPRSLRAVCADEANAGWITGDSEGQLERWRDGRSTLLGRRPAAITSVAVDPSGRVASGDEAGCAAILGATEEVFEHGDFVRCVRFTQDGALATASYDGRARVLRGGEAVS